MRYSIFEEHLSILQSDILVHLDADMLIESNPWGRVRRKLEEEDMCFVQHPGYWRPRQRKKMIFYFTNSRRLISDVLICIQNGALGVWETDKRSKAYIPRNKRKRYYCGGIWFGKRLAFIRLIHELSNNVKIDVENEVMAKWHDESHLNHWASKYNHTFDSPELCFDYSYGQLNELSPVIVAVRKKEKTR